MNDYDWEKEPDDAERAAEYRKVPKESWDDDDTIDSGDDNDAKTLVSEPSTLTSEADYIHFVKIKGSKSYETYLVPGYESKDGLAASAIYTYQTSLSSATVLQLYRGIAGAQTEAMAKVRNFSVYMKNDQSGEMEQINKDARFVYAKGIVNVLKL